MNRDFSGMNSIFNGKIQIMRKLLICITALAFGLQAHSQIIAITQEGDEVLLHNDGTWNYTDAGDKTEITVNTKKFKKDNASTFQIKSSNVDFGFWINPKEWNFKKGISNDDAEFELTLKDEDLYAMIITEKIEVPIESLGEIALENAKLAAPDIRVVQQEFRNVNGLDVLFMQMDGTTQGIKFSYYSYYFSNESGTVQFVTYTSQNLLNTYREKCEQLLNGMVQL